MTGGVRIDGARIVDWESLHDELDRVFGFPDFYGRNLDALVDCLSDLDAGTGMTRVRIDPGDVLCVEVADAAELKARAPEVFEALVESLAFVNHRRVEVGDAPVLAVAYRT